MTPITPTQGTDYEAAERKSGHPLILLVDDEKDIRELLTEMLEMRGYAVIAVGSGTEALGCLEEYPFDLVITDLGMEGTSGMEVARMAKTAKRGTPVILITGWAESEKELEENTDDIDRLVSKPFSLTELGNAVDDFVKSPPGKN
ncbi:MAG: response regulator [bacterium]|nr:response regulator [bacterium]